MPNFHWPPPPPLPLDPPEPLARCLQGRWGGGVWWAAWGAANTYVVWCWVFFRCAPNPSTSAWTCSVLSAPLMPAHPPASIEQKTHPPPPPPPPLTAVTAVTAGATATTAAYQKLLMDASRAPTVSVTPGAVTTRPWVRAAAREAVVGGRVPEGLRVCGGECM